MEVKQVKQISLKIPRRIGINTTILSILEKKGLLISGGGAQK